MKNKLTKQEKDKIYREKNKEKIKAYRDANKEKQKIANAKWRSENSEYKKEQDKIYKLENKDDITLQNKTYYESNKDKQKQYRQDNKIIIAEKRKDYNIKNKSILVQKRKLHYELNKETYLLKARLYLNNKYKTDNLFKLRVISRNLIRKSIKRNGYSKNAKTQEILGYSFEEFKLHLESKFTDWMNWDNHGLYNGSPNYGWDIDHIKPLASATTENELLKLNHYTNLQPLCSYINRDIKKDNPSF